LLRQALEAALFLMRGVVDKLGVRMQKQADGIDVTSFVMQGEAVATEVIGFLTGMWVFPPPTAPCAGLSNR
jgi:hypothetical protein